MLGVVKLMELIRGFCGAHKSTTCPEGPKPSPGPEKSQGLWSRLLQHLPSFFLSFFPLQWPVGWAHFNLPKQSLFRISIFDYPVSPPQHHGHFTPTCLSFHRPFGCDSGTCILQHHLLI